MVVIDVHDAGPVTPQELDRHPVDVAAVQEDEGPIDDVRGRLVEDLLERQKAVLDRKGELLRVEEHDRVLAQLAQHVVHREQRSERVAVRALMGGEQEALARAQRLDDAIEIGGHGRRAGHSESSSLPSRTARSGPSS